MKPEFKKYDSKKEPRLKPIKKFLIRTGGRAVINYILMNEQEYSDYVKLEDINNPISYLQNKLR